jgi:hypothetical protein
MLLINLKEFLDMTHLKTILQEIKQLQLSIILQVQQP